MASTKAQLAKDKGNAAFKTGDYPVAIGHYTEAILAKPDDPTFPLNRAAAYLKLGKNEDAERDCTTVVKLHASNVKALFRRGQARIALSKLSDAQQDLKEALSLEPANGSVKQELKKVESLLVQTKSKHSAKVAANITPSTSASTSPQRRRIPIQIVEPAAGSSSKAHAKPSAGSALHKQSMPSQQLEKDFMKPVSSRSLTSASTSIATQQNSESRSTDNNSSPTPSTFSPKPITFLDAKQARESTKPSGGIFRSSGDHTIFDKGEKQSSHPLADRAATKASPPPPAAMKGTSQKPNSFSSTKPPMSLFNFTRSWESLDLAGEKWDLISQIPPTSLPALFQTSLEPSLLVSILDTFLAVQQHITDPENDDRARMRQYMAMFSKVSRFSTIVLLMSKKEKEKAKEVWEKIGVRNGGAAWGIS